MNSRLSININPVKCANLFFLLCYFALTIFTPFYSLQNMRLLLLFWVLWFLSSLQIDGKLIKESVLLLTLMGTMLLMAMIASFIKEDVVPLNSVINAMPNFAWAIVGIFYVHHSQILKNVKWIMLGIILISIIYTLIGNILYPEASRLLAGTVEYYEYTREYYRSLNIGGYGFIYSLVFLVMPLNILLKSSKSFSIQRVILLILIILLIVTLIISSYMTAIIMLFFMSVFSLSKNDKIIRNIIILGILLLFIWGYRSSLLSLLSSIGRYIGSDILIKRSEQLLTGSYLSEAGVDQNNRLTIFRNAILNWLDSPILGSMFGNIENIHRRSGHSELLGYLENWGLFSLIYFLFFRIAYLKIKQGFLTMRMKNSYQVYFILLIIFITIDRFNTFLEIGCIAFFFGPALMKISEINFLKKNE